MAKNKTSKLQVKLIKSAIGHPKRQKDTIKALGLRKIGQMIEHQDTPAIRGMIGKVSHLVQVDEISA